MKSKEERLGRLWLDIMLVIGFSLAIAICILALTMPVHAQATAPEEFEPATVAIGGVLLIPLIVGLIQLAKKLVPNAPGNVWLLVAFVLGMVGQVLTVMLAQAKPLENWAFDLWVTTLVQGAAFGLAAAKAYDELIDPETSVWHRSGKR